MDEKIILGTKADNTLANLDLDRFWVEGLAFVGITGTQKSSFVASILKQVKQKEDVQIIIIEKDRQFKVLRTLFPMIWISNDGELLPVISQARSLGRKVRETGASVMLDLSSFNNWSDRQKFIGEFTLGILDVQDPIYSKKCIYIMDESQLIIPQGKKSGAIDAVSELVQTGRKYKIRPIIVTQSISEVDKSVSRQISTRIFGRVSEDIDRQRISQFLTGKKQQLFNELLTLGDGIYYARGSAISSELIQFTKTQDDSLKGWDSKELYPLNEQGQRWVREIRSGLTDTKPTNEIDSLKIKIQQQEFLIEDLRKQNRKERNEGYADAIRNMQKLVEQP
jgi:hypothetical protein